MWPKRLLYVLLWVSLAPRPSAAQTLPEATAIVLSDLKNYDETRRWSEGREYLKSEVSKGHLPEPERWPLDAFFAYRLNLPLVGLADLCQYGPYAKSAVTDRVGPPDESLFKKNWNKPIEQLERELWDQLFESLGKLHAQNQASQGLKVTTEARKLDAAILHFGFYVREMDIWSAEFHGLLEQPLAGLEKLGRYRKKNGLSAERERSRFHMLLKKSAHDLDIWLQAMQGWLTAELIETPGGKVSYRSVNGDALPLSDRPVPLDPGRYVVTATWPGAPCALQESSRIVTVGAGTHNHVEVKLRQLLEQGCAARANSDPAAAVTALESAARLAQDQDPSILLALAESYARTSQRPLSGLAVLSRLASLQLSGTDLEPDVQAVRALQERLRGQLGRLEVSTNVEGARAAVKSAWSQRPLALKSLKEDAVVNPGTYQIVVQTPQGAQHEGLCAVAPGKLCTLSIQFPTATPRWRTGTWVGLLSLSVGSMLLTTWLLPQQGDRTCAYAPSCAREVHTLTQSLVLLVGGTVGVGLAITNLALDRRSATRRAQPKVWWRAQGD